MSTPFVVATLLELGVSSLIVYGLIHEEKVIEFEKNIKRIILGNIRRAIRISRQKREVK